MDCDRWDCGLGGACEEVSAVSELDEDWRLPCRCVWEGRGRKGSEAAGFRVGCLWELVLKDEEVPDFLGSRAVLRALTVLWVRWSGEEFLWAEDMIDVFNCLWKEHRWLGRVG